MRIFIWQKWCKYCIYNNTHRELDFVTNSRIPPKFSHLSPWTLIRSDVRALLFLKKYSAKQLNALLWFFP
ncbi:MAG: hypothetical protein PHO32_06025, partial [Candidatus Cloacimonetes bacterium]|nr:hypothetical protein [Candidatus Cloacimonadota bacterium]